MKLGRAPTTESTVRAGVTPAQDAGSGARGWRRPVRRGPVRSRAMRVLVTGGGGFIGSHLVERLLRDGHEVRVIDNFATGRRENLVPFLDDVELVEGDIQSYERAHTAVRGCEVVLHQAALPSVPRSIQDPLTTNSVNVVG